MKILVLSDSHSTLSFMRRCIDSVQPHAVIHLGDHFDDAEAMKEEGSWDQIVPKFQKLVEARKGREY